MTTIARSLNPAAIAGARIMGVRNVAGGRGRQRIAAASFDTPRPLTVYSQCLPGPVPGSGRGGVGDFRDHRIKLFAQIGAGAFSVTGEIPANKHFGIVAQEVTIFGEVWSQYPTSAAQADSSLIYAIDPLQTVDCNVGIVDGVADASLPSVFVPSPINRLGGSAFYGQAIGNYGLIAPANVPCVLQSLGGFNAGAAAYLHVLGELDRWPFIVIPVAAGETFYVDFTTSGGRPFPLGAQWFASASPNLSTTGETTNALALHVEAEVSFL